MSEGTKDRSPDVYVRQLHEIFVSCDSSGSGLLNRDDLQRLCRRLNLESDICKRITDSLCVAAGDHRCVGFDEFKETFVNVLSETEQMTDDGNQPSTGRLWSDGTENAVDLSEEERHLLDIWKELGVGANGHLNLSELQQVIQFLNMGHMTCRETEALFTRLDVDGDGSLSFSELLHGLFEIGEIGHPEHLPARPTALLPANTGRTLSLPLRNSYDRSFETHSAPLLRAHEGILAFLKKEGSGFADSEMVVNLWESLGVREGHLILKLMRFDEKQPVSLLHLSLALVDEIHSTDVDNNILYQAALTTVEHALDYLHCANEDLKLERDRLHSDLSAMKNRNAVIVDEFDEFCSSTEAQKTNEQQLAAKYEEVLTQLQQKSDECTQLLSQLNGTKREVASLIGKLDHTNKAKAASALELFQLSQKCSILEKELEQKEVDHQLLKDLQQQVTDLELGLAVANSNAANKTPSSIDQELIERLELENKELKDRLDEQTIRLTDLMRQLKNGGRSRTVTSKERTEILPLNNEEFRGDEANRESYEMELQNLMRGMSVERKDIEGAYRLEIADLEQRHHDQLSVLRKEFENEKDELISGHKRHLAEAVAERERDLLTEFSKETAQHYADSADVKELQERLRLAQETAEERSRYAKELETKLLKMQDAWTAQESEKMRADAGKELDERLMERFGEEKQRMLAKFEEDLAIIREEHKQDLGQLSIELTQSFGLEKEKVLASFVAERRNWEQKLNSLENDLQTKDLEKERHSKEFEELRKEGFGRERWIKELEKDLKKKEGEKELLKKDFETELRMKLEEQDFLKREVEKLKTVEKTEFQKKLKEKSRESSDGYFKLQVDELCRNNVRLKDELEKRDGELLRLRQELEHNRQLKRDQPGGGDREPTHLSTVAMVDVKDVLMEKNLLKQQLQLTVRQLAEATSALSLMSQELNKEKEMAKKCLGQMIERAKYEDLIARLHDAEAKAHHLQHDCDFKAAETTKLLSLSQTVNRQKLRHLTEENEKLQKQLKQRAILINDQQMTITKQAEELVKGDALIRDLYIENAHLVRCLQMTEGHRQDSDSKVQVLHEKCLALGRLLRTVGPTAFSHK